MINADLQNSAVAPSECHHRGDCSAISVLPASFQTPILSCIAHPSPPSVGCLQMYYTSRSPSFKPPNTPCAEAPCFLVASPLLFFSGCNEAFLGNTGSMPPSAICNSNKCLARSNLHGTCCSLMQREVFSVDQFTAVEPGSFTPPLNLDQNAEMVGVYGIGFPLMGNFGAWEINRKRQNIKIS